MNGSSYENNSIEEAIKQPYTIQLYTKNSPAFNSVMKDFPSIRIEKIVRGDFVVFYMDSRMLSDLLERVNTSYIEMYPDVMTLLGKASLDASTITEVQRNQFLDLRGRGTLVGIIDTGIDYTKEVFQFRDGVSKIRYIWDQTIEGNSPYGFSFGSEYTNEQINRALQSDTPFNYVPSVDTDGHGTFLASVAAGRKDFAYIGAAPEAELLIVKLRKIDQASYDINLIPRNQENAYSAADVMLAIDYMIDKAYEHSMPLAICIGLGSNMSGHDSYEIIEQYMTGISLLNGICICTAAGNESNAGHHAGGSLSATNSTYNIQIRVPENSSNFMLNIYANASDRMSVSLKSPLGEVIPRAVAVSGQRTETRLILERARIGVEYYFPVTAGGSHFIHIRFYNPTPGIWDITLYGDIILDGRFDAWLPITGLATPGIQFINPDPFSTITTPGTAMGSITCGAYNDKDNSLYIRSSWGPSRNKFQKPDLVAPGVDVSGIYPMGTGTMTGTGVAAAITAGACALILQWGIVDKNDVSLNTNRIKALLIKGCNRDLNIQYPSLQWGYGKLDLLNTFRQLRSF